MTKYEMQQVRDALLRGRPQIVGALIRRDQDEALRILDAELAKPEQEPMYFGLTHDHTWLSITPSRYKKLKPDMRMKVYTAPVAAPQREWVSLTEEDMVHCLTQSSCIGTIKMSFESGAYSITRPSINADRLLKQIEAALKEKNHG